MSAVIAEPKPIEVKMKYHPDHHTINADDCTFCSNWVAGKYPNFELFPEDPEWTIVQLKRAGF